ncbi:MAG: hypothetical protein ACOX7N_04900 [Lawsonibacter sp.]
MARQAKIVEVKGQKKISKTADSEFAFQYQRAILLSLKDCGLLNQVQYEHAERMLIQQVCPKHSTNGKRLNEVKEVDS